MITHRIVSDTNQVGLARWRIGDRQQSVVFCMLEAKDVFVFVMELVKQTVFRLDNLVVQSTFCGIQLEQLDSSMCLGYHEFKQLIDYSNVLKSALKKRPEHAKTLVEYEMLLRHQTKFILGKTLYCKVSHIPDDSELQFIEYMMVDSLTVQDEIVVCPARILIRLNLRQFEVLLSHKRQLNSLLKKLVKSKKKRNKSESSQAVPKKRRTSSTPTQVCDLPEYLTCTLTSSQKKCETSCDSDTDIFC